MRDINIGFFLLAALVAGTSLSCSAKEELAGDAESRLETETRTPATPAAAGGLLEAVGRYALSLDSDAGWHRNILEIGALEGGAVSGLVSIDLGIGPEGRAPTPDEKVHTLSFRTTHDSAEPYRLRFSVTVGQMSAALYTFDLHLCPHAGPQRCGETREGFKGDVVVESASQGKARFSAAATAME